jgi:TolB-like protein
MRRTIPWTLAVAGMGWSSPVTAQDAQPVIAVLPFEDTGSYGQDKEAFEALEVGLPDILASTLAAHPGVRVVDRPRLRQALEQQKLGAAHRLDAASATEVAKAAGARYAVTGSFADFYGKFRINARVVDAQSGQILKVASNDDPKLQDRSQLAAIVQVVADRITGALGLAPYPPDIAAKRRALPTEALTEFSRGLMFEGRGDRAKAAEAYQRALTVAPDYGEARDGLQRVRAS